MKSGTICQFANIGLQVTNEVRSSPKEVLEDLISAVFFFTCVTEEHSLCHGNLIRLLREGVTKDFARDKMLL